MLLALAVPAMSRSTPRRGFTLIELAVVATIIALLAALALAAVNQVSRRGTLAVAHKTIAGAYEQAKSYAIGHATDVIFVIVGNASPADAAACGGGFFSSVESRDLDVRCVRYFLLEDSNTGLLNQDARFTAATLGNFDPQIRIPLAGGLVQTNTGDTLLASGSLGRGVMIGTAPGYVPVQPVANSIYEGMIINAAQPCSFCVGLPPVRGWIRFGADGKVAVGGNAANLGGFLSFTGVGTDGVSIPSTHYVLISAPGGLVSERLSKTGK